MTAKKSRRGWIASNFFSEEDSSLNPQPKVRASSKKVNLKAAVEDVEFFNKLEPKTVEELAVHTMKVAEIRGWLDYVTNSISNDRTVPMLLITGPTGSGKTTTLKVLCKSMKIDIQEWVNPIDKDYELFRGPGQSSRLLEFLNEAKYPSLMVQVPNNKKITLIEDFPNTLQNNPVEFDNILDACVSNGKLAIVFICTNVSNNNINLVKNLFTDEIIQKYQIYVISFNACSATLLRTAIKRAQAVVQEHPDSLKLPVQSTVNAILASSMGDIRCALNQYYFASLKGTAKLPTEFNNSKLKTGQKRQRGTNSSIKTMCKDEVLGLFRSIGRVLNPKRREHCGSWRIDCDLGALVDELSVQPNMFNAFLYENYLKYFCDFEDACKAADVLSTSQTLMERWVGQDEILVLALWISVMGLMIFNEHRVSKWTQITGPKKVNIVINTHQETKKMHVSDHFYYSLIKKKDRFHKFEYCCKPSEK